MFGIQMIQVLCISTSECMLAQEFTWLKTIKTLENYPKSMFFIIREAHVEKRTTRVCSVFQWLIKWPPSCLWAIGNPNFKLFGISMLGIRAPTAQHWSKSNIQIISQWFSLIQFFNQTLSSFSCMLTLEFWCIQVVGVDVLVSRTIPNC